MESFFLIAVSGFVSLTLLQIGVDAYVALCERQRPAPAFPPWLQEMADRRQAALPWVGTERRAPALMLVSAQTPDETRRHAG